MRIGLDVGLRVLVLRADAEKLEKRRDGRAAERHRRDPDGRDDDGERNDPSQRHALTSPRDRPDRHRGGDHPADAVERRGERDAEPSGEESEQ